MKDIINTLLENYLVVIIIVIAIILYLFRNKIKGKLGEIKSSNELNKLDREEYKVLDNIILYSDNKTHEIDNIVISKYGLFIIEMKNYIGKVSGSKDDDKWTHYAYKNVNKFYNPVKQNYGHMRCVSDALKLDMRYLIPVVVFSNDTYIDSDVKYVIDAWAVDKFREQELVSDSTGYSARLLTVDELHNNLGYGNKNVVNENVPEWVYSTGTWTFPYYSSNTGTLLMTNGNIIGMRSYNYSTPVRPVVTLKKSALE